jgi:SnoaL-like domain
MRLRRADHCITSYVIDLRRANADADEVPARSLPLVQEVAMYELQNVVDRYFDAWNETDAKARLTLIGQAWTSDGRYVDPLSDVDGHEGFSTMVAGVQEQFPGYRVRRTSPIDRHHDQVRFEWEIVAPDGTVAVVGVDYGKLAADGRLQSIGGFFGTAVPAEAAA